MAVSQQVSHKPRQFRHFDNLFTRRVTGNGPQFGVEKNASTVCSSHSAEAPNVSWFVHASRGARGLSPALAGGIFLQYFRISDLESRLGVSKSTIYRLIKEGEFDVVKIGHSVRVTEESLDAYITSHTTFGTAVTR